MGIYQPVRLKIRPRTFISALWVRHVPEEGRAEVKLEGFRTDAGRGEVSFRMADDGKMQGMLYLIPEGEGRAAELAKPLDAVITDGENASAALISSCEACLAAKESVDAFTLRGGRTVFLELPAGSYDLCGVKAEVNRGFMMPRHFASRDTGPPWVKGFRAKARERKTDNKI